mgnify:CR=1 FL=1
MWSKEITRSIKRGAVASFGLSLLYGILISWTMPNWQEAWATTAAVWYLLIAIIVSFGVQFGLWSYLRIVHYQTSSAVPGMSGATSSVSMLACCAHHLVDLLPLWGLSGAVLFLGQYQRPLLVISLAINLLSIAYLLYVLTKRQHIQ